jgi:phytoene synthase
VTITATSPTVRDAFAECEAITRREARNFHYGIRLLAPEKRSALSAVYALARRVDDIGDGDLPPAAKKVALAGLRADLADLDRSSDPVLLAVAEVARRMPLPVEAFLELVDGVETDLDIDTLGHRFAGFDELTGYCRCVAGSIGRLCLGVFGVSDPVAGPRLADALGIGLQQINILRDVREDLAHGRVYLPTDELDAAGVTLGLDPAGALVWSPELARLIRRSGLRARAWYDDGIRLVSLLDRRSAACTLTMAGIYSRLLDTIVARPDAMRERRLSLPARSKAGVALRALRGRAA